NNSLQGLRDSINVLAGETGVYASIINNGREDDGYHLILSGKDASSGFSLGYSLHDSEGNPIPFSDARVREAQQAIAYIDGIEVVSSSNTLANVIAGLTINLNNESEILLPAEEGIPPVYDTTTLSIDNDPSWVKEKLATFVSSYNEVMKWISSGYREGSAGEGEEGASHSSLLRGDAAINDVKRHLQSILTDAVTGGSLRILSETGIATQRDGSLLVDDKKLDTVLQTKFEDVVKLLAGDASGKGVMGRFNDYLVRTTSPTEGMYAGKQDSYEAAVHRLDRQIAQKEPLMAKIEERIRAQFNAMELLVNNLNAHSDYFSQQMNLFANLTTGKNT
ncbi:MAG: flagellar filament capping protein FliD, partial [Desulforhopalus sp.]